MILITGAAGLLGTHLAHTLAANGEQIRLFDFRVPESIPKGAEFIQGDIRNMEDVKPAVDGAGTVYHLAALMHVGKLDPGLIEQVNVGGVRNLMRAAQSGDVSRIVFASTIELYGVAPPNPCYEDSPKSAPRGYPLHKLTGERMLAEFSRRTGIETVFPRMPMILGPGFYHFKLMLLLFEFVSAGLPVPLLDGGVRKGRMVSVDDAVRGLRLCAETPGISARAYNICAEDVFTHRGFIQNLIDAAGSRSRIVDVPSEPVIKANDRIRRRIELPVADEHFQFSLHDCNYAIDRARAELGYRPQKTASESLVETYESYINGGRRAMRKKLSNNLLRKAAPAGSAS